MSKKSIIKILTRNITLMLVPHEYTSVKKVRMPLIVFVSILFIAISLISLSIYFVNLGVEYKVMEVENKALLRKIPELQKFAEKLKNIETALTKKLNAKSRREILEDKERIVDDKNKGDNLSSKIKQIKYEFENIENYAYDIQRFLDEKTELYNSIPRGSPVPKMEISSGYGKRSINALGGNYTKFHKGVDISYPEGNSVLATAPGVITFADWKGGYGKLVIINHLNGFSTIYAHNSKLKVKVGDKVKKGDVIALVGATGHATASHVHYEVRVHDRSINPCALIYDEEDEVMKYVF